tara:strand:+ start:210 stop:629 length:420 start_codon:yes stop_codon:yes gene_type:complete
MENTENEMLIAVEYVIDYDGFESLIVTALEGGINYWANIEDGSYKKINDWSEANKKGHEPFSVRFAQYIWSGGTVVISDSEGEEFDDPIGEISLESIKKGWQLFSQQRHHFSDFLDNNTDAITADVWFQCCSLGDVVYG